MKNFLLFAILCLGFAACKQRSDEDFSYKYLPVKEDDKWSYIDENGKQLIGAKFNSADLFSNGLALVSDEHNKYGYINEQGEYVIKAQYISATYFSEGLAFVLSPEGYPECIDTKGKIVFELKQADFAAAFHEGLARIGMDNKVGFVDKSGKFVINPSFDDAGDFLEGLAVIQNHVDNNERDGFINTEGKVIVEPQFLLAENFSNGLAIVVNTEGNAGYINKTGEMIIKPSYSSATMFSDEHALVMNNNEWCIVSTTGKLKALGYYDAVNNYNGGLIGVKKDRKWGYINEAGDKVIELQYDDASTFYDKGFATVLSGGKYGIIDKKGKYLVAPKYNDIFNDIEGVGLSDKSKHFAVVSDYVNVEEIADRFVGNGNEGSFRKINSETTLNNIYDTYGIKNMSIREMYLDDSTKIPLGPNAIIASTDYLFGMLLGVHGQIFNEVARANPKVETIQYTVLLRRDVEGFANALKQVLIKKYSASEIPTPETEDELVTSLEKKHSSDGIDKNKHFVLYAAKMAFMCSIINEEAHIAIHFKK